MKIRQEVRYFRPLLFRPFRKLFCLSPAGGKGFFYRKEGDGEVTAQTERRWTEKASVLGKEDMERILRRIAV